IAGTIELVDSAFLTDIPGWKHDAGTELLGIKAKYPDFSWKSQEIRPGLPRDAFDMNITVLTPRGRATHAIVAAMRREGEVNTADFKPALFNNGFLFAAIHQINFFRSANPGWTEVTGVECWLKDGRVIQPIFIQLDPVNFSINNVPYKLVDLQALFPLWLLESDQELRFAIFFQGKDPYIVKFSAKKVRDLR
ncbi:MAG: hypothetical protein AB1752_12515, partial [Candidatus Zixiibacteriota bacterium]